MAILRDSTARFSYSRDLGISKFDQRNSSPKFLRNSKVSSEISSKTKDPDETQNFHNYGLFRNSPMFKIDEKIEHWGIFDSQDPEILASRL